MKPKGDDPRLPRALGLPLRMVPARLYSALAATVLERIFTEQRRDGEMDFMDGRGVSIRVLDAGIELNLSAGPDGFHSRPASDAADLSIEGTAYDYLLLISGREDPDTLFFQRRLRMSGDTALGVHLKNFLAAADPDTLPLAGLLRPGLLQGIRVYERLLG